MQFSGGHAWSGSAELAAAFPTLVVFGGRHRGIGAMWP